MGATCVVVIVPIVVGFQSTPPYGGRPKKPFSWDNIPEVSIHAPVWGATRPDLSTELMRMFQSTPPYGGRQPFESLKQEWQVSIHAPVWGATDELHRHGIYIDVSIHAPVWGATFAPARPMLSAGFQSTPPYGGRLDCGFYSVLCGVSIHAPVWGATPTLKNTYTYNKVSIHAPVWGATPGREQQ